MIVRVHGLRAAREGGEALLHGRKLRSADDADARSIFVIDAGEHAGEVRRVGEAELDAGDIRRRAWSRRS